MINVRIMISIYKPDLNFLREQITSLLCQSNVNVYLSIRIDGLDFEREYLISFLNDLIDGRIEIEFFEGENVGPGNSFLKLLSLCNKNCDYYAFCDQDDFWEKEKLESAINKMVNIKNENIAYCSTLKNVDENLKLISKTEKPKIINFRNSLSENIITGCTLVINKAVALDIVNNLPSSVNMHDSWIYTYIMAFGELYFDRESYIRYRQHNSNVVGSVDSKKYYLKKSKKFIKNFANKSPRETFQLEKFWCTYNTKLSRDKREDLEVYLKLKLSFKSRLLALFYFKRNGFFENMILKFKIILGIV
jgi:hypothetical protein